jgi:hypothetical protein
MMTRITLVVAIAVVVRPLISFSGPTTPTVETIIAHHLAAAARGDVDSMMTDYAADAVLITPDTAITGKRAIRAVFQRLVGGNAAPGGSPGGIAGTEAGIQGKCWIPIVGAAPWHTRRGTRFRHLFFRDGKIVAQTVAMLPASARHN